MHRRVMLDRGSDGSGDHFSAVNFVLAIRLEQPSSLARLVMVVAEMVISFVFSRSRIANSCNKILASRDCLSRLFPLVVQ